MIQRLSICRTSERLGVTSGWVSTYQFRLALLHLGLHYPLLHRSLLPVIGTLLNKPVEYHSVLIAAQVCCRRSSCAKVLQWKVKKCCLCGLIPRFKSIPKPWPKPRSEAPSGPAPASLSALKPPPSMAALNADPSAHNRRSGENAWA